MRDVCRGEKEKKWLHVLLHKLQNLIIVVAGDIHPIDSIEKLSNFSSLCVASFDVCLHIFVRSEMGPHVPPFKKFKKNLPLTFPSCRTFSGIRYQCYGFILI